MGMAVGIAASVQACVGDEPPPPATTPNADGGETTPDAGGALLTAPTCASNQLVCEGGCVDVSPQRCGGCKTVCPPSAPLCATGSGTPTCVLRCADAQTKCGDQCVSTADNPNFCGSCTTKCPAPANGLATCSAGRCSFECKPGFHPCGDHCAADDDATQCGATCMACPAPANGTASCTAATGTCTFACSGGRTICPATNECVLTTSDKNNCGACGKVCQIATSCTASVCNVKLGNVTPFGEKSYSPSSYFGGTAINVPAPMTVTALGTYIAEYTQQHSIALGLYANNAGHPGARLATTGPVLITSIGTKEFSVTPTAINAGTYFVMSIQETYAKFGMNTAAGNYEHLANGSSLWNGGTLPSAAPATQTIGGSLNFHLVGKE